MSYQRGILSLVLLGSLALALTQASDLIVGSTVSGDHLVRHEALKINGKFLHIVTADRTFNTTSNETISQVRLFDQNKYQRIHLVATATITAGGPGFQNVTVHFKSKRGHGINFVCELYGQ